MKTRPNGHIWMAAEQFYNSAEYIWSASDLDISRYVYPLIVNYAFSCELSLKSSEGLMKLSEVTPEGLLMASNIESSVRGHDLNSVFRKLKPETQRVIEDQFASCTGKELHPLLRECSNYFEEGRYSFEQKAASYSVSEVRLLAKGLLDAVMRFGEENA
ncbi:MAG: hypothetical protein ACRES7_09095 [Gammaproteobacteria bacterium]